MGRVYPFASGIIIWLGPGDTGGLDAIKTIEEDREPSDPQRIKALMRICERPWFRRVWVAQELALAREDPIVHIGHYTFLWDTLYQACLASYEINFKTPKLGYSEFWSVASATVGIGDVRTSAIRRRWKGRTHKPEEQDDFFHKLSAATYGQATDPCDTVYGVLGITRPDLPIHADYTKSVAEVYIESVGYLLENDFLQCFLVWSLHAPRDESITESPGVTGLPSWVMDLSITSQLRKVHSYYYSINLCVDFMTLEEKLDEGRNKFRRLARIGHANKLHTVGKFQVMMQLHDTILEPKGFTNEQLVHGSIGKHWIHNHLDCGVRATLEKFRTAPHDQPVLSEDETQCLEEVLRACTNNTVFLTCDGHMGMVYHPDGILAGDIVVGLFRTSMTFVLRPLDDGTYHMINTAYLTQSGRDCEDTTAEDVWEDPGRFCMQRYTIV